MKKLIRYRISIAVKFPATHPRKHQATFFVPKIEDALGMIRSCDPHSDLCKSLHTVCERCYYGQPYNERLLKIHTIRGNYELWAKRFEKINRGVAVIELYYWSGKPYASKQVVFLTLGKDDGIGLQKLEFSASGLFGMIKIDDDFPDTSIASIAQNDGLSLDDFKAWFKGADLSKPLAIIHFTDFRY